MFGIGGFELFLIILFGFLIFGPDKLPEIAKTVGMAINKFKKAKEEMDGVIREEVFDPSADEPFKNPSKALDRAHSAAKAKIKRAEGEETFAERKARYDRERAERKARAEVDQKKQAEIDANRAKMKQEAAAKAEAQAAAGEAGGSAATDSPAETAATAAPAKKPEPASASKPDSTSASASVSAKPEPKSEAPKASSSRPTADQLYGNVPLNKNLVREVGKNGAASESIPAANDASAKGGDQ